MSSQENKQVALNFIELLDRKLLEGAFALVADDAIIHLGGGWEVSDKKTMLAVEQAFSKAMPDLKHHLTSDSLVAEGDFVSLRCTVSGTHLGEFDGLPATGKKVTAPLMAMWRIVNGKIVEHWHLTDTSYFKSQLISSS